MKSFYLVVIFSVIFIFFGFFNYNKVDEFCDKYSEQFDMIETLIKEDNWDKSSKLLEYNQKQLDIDKNTWYKLLNHEYFNSIFSDMRILRQSIYLKNKMISLEKVEAIKGMLDNLKEDETFNFNRIF